MGWGLDQGRRVWTEGRGGRKHGGFTAPRAQPQYETGGSYPFSRQAKEPGHVIEDFHRIKRLPPYVFAEVNRLKAAARARGADIIDLGMGNPDLPTPPHIVAKMVETIAKPRTHRYSASKGIPGLRKAQAAYYERRFGVKLDPDTQVVATLGSKEGFANMAQAITAPGDIMIVPNPTYPIHEFGFIIAGAAVRHVPAGTGEEFLRAVEHAVRHSIPKPLGFILSYPSNPTAMVASLDFYKDAVALAKKLDLIILSDIAYSELYFDGNPPPSVLQVPGAMDMTVEFTSLSKTYNMPGWRMGFAVGNERLIGGAGTRQVVPGLWRFHAHPGRGGRRAQRSAGLRRRDPRDLQGATRLSGRELRTRGLGDPAAAGDDVCMVPNTRAVPASGFGRIR